MSKITATVAALLLASSVMSQACFDPVYGTSLGSANDTVHPAQSIGHAFPFDGATYTDIHISDHGVCWLSNGGLPAPAAPGAVTYNILLSDFVLFGPCIAPFWADANNGYAPVTLGEVFINNTDPTKCVVTWSGMWTFQSLPPQYDVQMTLSDSGNITFVYSADVNNYGSTFAQNAIVGVTPGSNAFLPAATDLSAGGTTTNPSIFEEFVTASTFDMMSDGIQLIPTSPGWVVLPLGGTVGCASSESYGAGCGAATLTLDGNAPHYGSNWGLTTTNIDAVSPFAITFFGSRGPAIPMPLIGLNAPGCDINLAAAITNLTGATAAGSATVTIPIPNNPALAGFQIGAQSICLTVANASGLLSSNGVEGTIGL